MIGSSLWSRFSKKAGVRHDELKLGRSLSVAVVMVVLIVVASIVMTNHITDNERKRCFDLLFTEARDIASSIETSINNDREVLQLLADVVAQSDDFNSPQLWNLMKSFDHMGFMSQLALLMPDDTIIYGAGQSIDASGLLSFNQELIRGKHISPRSVSLLDSKNYVLRHFCPVNRDGRVIALLYGVIRLQDLPVTMAMRPYGGKGAMFLIEAESGNFLIDTWHTGRLGNLRTYIGKREIASGYDVAKFRRGFAQGEVDYISAKSRTVGEYLYLHYQPVGVNDWRIVVSVPESVVMANALYIEQVLHIFLGVEIFCFALYLLWVLNDVRRVTAEKQRRLETIQNIHEIEQFLFNAHEKKENLFAAIEKLGKIMGAGHINFWMLDRGLNYHFRWEQGQPAEECEKVSLPPVKLLKSFASGSNLFEAHTPQQIAAIVPDALKAAANSSTAANDPAAPADNVNVAATEAVVQVLGTKLRNIIAVPVRDVVAGQLSGVLAISNVNPDATNVPLLQAMGFSFGMFCNNVKNRADLKEQCERDALTGMLNRNRYERDLPELFEKFRAALTCIYIDVNGLREMNNTKGHDLGDVMLRTVAQAIENYFPDKYKYRVGGDEFVLFVPNGDEAKLTKCSQDLAADLEQYDYHVSVGIECESDVETISHLIKAAEQKMYDQKRAFYANRERRNMHVA